MNDRDVVVLGYACRVAGASEVSALWKLVAEGRDLVTRAATNIGATAGGRVHAYGLIEGTEQFDEGFFVLFFLENVSYSAPIYTIKGYLRCI